MRPVLLLVLFTILCRAHAKHLTTSFDSNSTVITTVISTWWPQVWPSHDHSHDHLILSVLFMKSDWGQLLLPDLCCTICPNQMFKLHLFSSLAGHRACFFLYPVIRSYTPCRHVYPCQSATFKIHPEDHQVHRPLSHLDQICAAALRLCVAAAAPLGDTRHRDEEHMQVKLDKTRCRTW